MRIADHRDSTSIAQVRVRATPVLYQGPALGAGAGAGTAAGVGTVPTPPPVVVSFTPNRNGSAVSSEGGEMDLMTALAGPGRG
jgi:hypothetical protein